MQWSSILKASQILSLKVCHFWYWLVNYRTGVELNEHKSSEPEATKKIAALRKGLHLCLLF
jgi:hypothetical protein